MHTENHIAGVVVQSLRRRGPPDKLKLVVLALEWGVHSVATDVHQVLPHAAYVYKFARLPGEMPVSSRDACDEILGR